MLQSRVIFNLNIGEKERKMGASVVSSDEEIIIKTKIRSRLAYIPSDESDVETTGKTVVDNDTDTAEGQKIHPLVMTDSDGEGKQTSTKKHLAYIHSNESDVETTGNAIGDKKGDAAEGQKRHPLGMTDSDSEGEQTSSQAPEDADLKTDKQDSDNDVPDENANSDKENAVCSTYSYKALFANKDLYDAESSDEESVSKPETVSCNVLKEDNMYDAEGSGEEDNVIVARTKVKKSPKQRRPSSKKQEPSELDQIRSESQRQVRKARVSLPYHKPRQRSLAEFLQRRPSIPTKSLRMSVDELELLGKQLEKRVKEAEEFYKSSSEEDAGNGKEAESVVQASVVTASTESKDCEMDLGIEGRPGKEQVPTAEVQTKIFRNSCELTEIDSQDLILKLDSETLDLLQDEKKRKSHDSQDLVLKLDSETLDLLQDKKEKKSQDRKITPTIDFLSGLDDCAMSGTEGEGEKRLSNSVPQHEGEETQDLYLHLSESEMCDILGPPAASEATGQSGDQNTPAPYVDPRPAKAEGTCDLSVGQHNSPVTAHGLETESQRNRVVVSQGTCDLSVAAESEGPCDMSTEQESSPVAARSAATADEIQLVLQGENAVICVGEVGSIAAVPTRTQVPNLLLEGDDAAVLLQGPPATDADVGEANHPNAASGRAVPPDTVEDRANGTAAQDSSAGLRSPDVSGFLSQSPLLKDCGSKLSGLATAKLRSPDDSVCMTQSPLLREGDSKLPGLTSKFIPTLSAAPKLKGSPSKMVDLDDAPNPLGVKVLMDRFIRHSLSGKKPPQKSTVDLSVVSVESSPGGAEPQLRREMLSVSLEEEAPAPRAKLQALRQELQQQIVRQREQEWARRQQQQLEEAAERQPDEKSDCGLLDDEDEEMEERDTTATESEEEEEEDLEAWAKREEKKERRVQSMFVDDEAEESDNEGGFENDDEGGNDNENDELSIEDEDNKDNKEKREQVAEITEIEITTSSSDSNGVLERLQPSKLKRIKTMDPFDSDDGYGELETSLSSAIPPYQPGGAPTQLADISVDDDTHFFPSIMAPPLPTPLAKRTCTLEVGSPTSQPVFSGSSPSAEICAGLGLECSASSADLEAELLGLCSGKFTSQPLTLSQDMEELATSIASAPSQPAEDKALKAADTQSTRAAHAQETSEGSAKPPVRRKLVVVSSDDEDEALSDKPKVKPKRKLDFSDDESTSDLSFKSDSDEEDKDKLDEDALVDYDSEENEIIVNPAEMKKKAADFFEVEAELSESEWDSADEDEKGLDTLEWEEGDDEKLDQAEVKEQLGKIHMRQVLDEDQREVRRLQELLLEDGEFHSEGGGRQRQFRWKNLNSLDDFAATNRTYDDEALADEEPEDEEEWRRKRFERETFLQEHKEKIEQEEELLAEGLKAKFKPLAAPQPKSQVKRGSFLARSEAALARIAQLARSGGDGPMLAPTNSRNFVFATLSNDPKEAERQVVKRKRTVTDVPVVKKPCLNTGLLDQIGY